MIRINPREFQVGDGGISIPTGALDGIMGILGPGLERGCRVWQQAYVPNALSQYPFITTQGGRFILGEAPVANPVIINGVSPK